MASIGKSQQCYVISEELPECSRSLYDSNPNLYCHFLNSNKECLKLEDTLGDAIEKVFIHNAQNVLLMDTLCVNVSLQNVSNVTVIESDRNSCEKDVQLDVAKSSINFIPKYVNILKVLKQSTVKYLSITDKFLKFKILNSNIRDFNINSSLFKSIEGNRIILTCLTLKNGNVFIDDENRDDFRITNECETLEELDENVTPHITSHITDSSECNNNGYCVWVCIPIISVLLIIVIILIVAIYILKQRRCNSSNEAGNVQGNEDPEEMGLNNRANSSN